MPIYEFYCPDCHTLFNFLARRVDVTTRPDCPRCGRREIERRPSVFSVARRRAEPGGGGEGGEGGRGPGPDLDDERVTRALESIAAEAEGAGEDDPRQMARMLRKLHDATGMPVGGRLERALRRLEAGEDPEAVEEDLGDALDEESDAGGGEAAPEAREAGGGAAAKARVSALRRELPPRTDPGLFDL